MNQADKLFANLFIRCPNVTCSFAAFKDGARNVYRTYVVFAKKVDHQNRHDLKTINAGADSARLK
jgi:hypothetical protein